MKKTFIWLLCLMFLLPPFQAQVQEEEDVRLRALIVGCDYFVNQDSTAPAARSNVQLLSEALLRDHREYSRIMTAIDKIATVSQLEEAVARAFQGADEDDVSLFYISTHGVYSQGRPPEEAALLLSDGETEEKLYAQTLRDMLDQIPGKKVLVLDACHSGAFIGKGLSFFGGTNAFQGGDYVVLCSAGGSEESWYWKSQDDGDPRVQYGASYFATVFSTALSPQSAADMNADGTITLQEIYRHMYDHYAASTPQVYPQEGDFPVFVYNPQVEGDHKVISGLTFDDDVLLPGQQALQFSFTLHEEARVYYQLIYYHQGAWDFDHSQIIGDGELTGGDVSPGRKMRTVFLETDQLDTAGYVMLLLITREDNQMQMRASRLLCVQPAEGELSLQVRAEKSFCPEEGDEMSVIVNHALPCSLSVMVENAQGRVVRRLSYSQPSRPQAFKGSTFYWDGKCSDGTWAPPGEYTVVVKTSTGGQKQELRSKPVQLLGQGET